jgi:hypothetical protein
MLLVDYCASCRRHVNGALSCPGCGTYFLTDSPVAESAEPTTAIPEQPEPVAVAVGGRAARRRHLARLRKHKRRAATATVFALFGGGLTLAVVPDGASVNHASAAAAPQTVDQAGTPTGVADPKPAPTTAATQQQSASASTQATPGTQPAVQQARPAAAPSTQAVTPAGTQASTQAGTRQVQVRSAAPRATPTATPSAAATPTATPTTAPATQPSSGTSAPATSSTTPPTICLLGLVCVN